MTLARAVIPKETNIDQQSRVRERIRGLRPYATNSTGSLSLINLTSRRLRTLR
jgi:hypothetical protein